MLYIQQKAQQPLVDMYSDLFQAVKGSAIVNISSLPEEALYASRFDYTAPDAFFDLKIPTAWGKFTDASTISNTIIEGYLTPDKRASVQVVVFKYKEQISQKLKGEKTLEIMRTLYGHDLRVANDKVLPDGRERLTWYAGKKNINGKSFFDSYGNSLYILTMVWEEPTANIYVPILEKIEESFTRE